jgi:hypothetical protein
MTIQETYDALTQRSLGTKVLPAALFDELKKRADAAGGIGFGTSGDASQPRCIGDFAAAIDGRPTISDAYVSDYFATGRTPALQALENAIGYGFGDANDDAVAAINARKGVDRNTRVTFEEWAEELNVIRVVVLPASVYDALKASADKFGGIGADSFDAVSAADESYGEFVPYCVAGHAAFFDTQGAETIALNGQPTLQALGKAFNTKFPHDVFPLNDNAVYAINDRKGAELSARVSFAEWAEELKVVRGDA